MEFTADLIARVYGRHPARAMPFAELRAGLDAARRAGDVFTAREGDLELFGYTNSCQFEGRWGLFSLIARGLILDAAAGVVVATPFPKFFNLGEIGAALPDLPFEVAEKLDGSLGIVFHHGGRWRLTTRGSFTSPQSAWGEAHLARHVRHEGLTPGTTYLVEIIAAGTRLVVPYDFEGLVLLGGYDSAGDELPRPALEAAAEGAGLRLAKAHAYPSFDALLEVCRALGGREEGFVVRFANGFRLKIKGEEYCRLHRLARHCSPLGVWEAMVKGEDAGVIRRDLPEEMRRDFDVICRLLDARLEAFLADLAAAHGATGHLSDKELGLLLQGKSAGPAVAQELGRWLFLVRKQDFLEAARRPGELRRQALRAIRPDDNRLAGYRPSTLADRFAAEGE